MLRSERPNKKREAGICVRKQKFWGGKLESLGGMKDSLLQEVDVCSR